VLCPGRKKTVTQWALRGLESPVAVARYTTGDITLTDQTPETLKPALPELPDLATELTEVTEAAAVVYEGVEPEDFSEDERAQSTVSPAD
jgi:hypothetical protein